MVGVHVHAGADHGALATVGKSTGRATIEQTFPCLVQDVSQVLKHGQGVVADVRCTPPDVPVADGRASPTPPLPAWN